MLSHRHPAAWGKATRFTVRWATDCALTLRPNGPMPTPPIRTVRRPAAKPARPLAPRPPSPKPLDAPEPRPTPVFPESRDDPAQAEELERQQDA
jgi:hypothetical protein